MATPYNKVKYSIDPRYKDIITKEDIDLAIEKAVLDPANDKNNMLEIFLTIKEDSTTKEQWVGYEVVYPPIDRIRRITGYLVGTTDRWNNAKRKELQDRVKHNT